MAIKGDKQLEADIGALVDGELKPEEEKFVMSIIEMDDNASRYHDTLRRQKDLLKEWWEELHSN
ncbi:MAG: hypothetical protein KGQ41_03895 [Alphaproteobacteria bacterium]|nr:hypothetical protein [Alphaproteobacteria bacterium]